MRTRRWIWVLVGMVLAGSLAGWWIHVRRTTSAASEILTVPVRRMDLSQNISGTGTVTTADSIDVQSTVSGTVAEVLVENGEYLTKDTRVLVLENPEIREGLRRAELELQQVDLKLADATSPGEYDLENARNKVAQANLTLAAREIEVAALKPVAPVAGVATEIQVVPGQEVRTGDVMLYLLDITTMKVRVQVPVAAASYISIGQEADVSLSGVNGFFPGEVISVGAAAEGEGNTVPVVVHLPAMEGIRTGIDAFVSLYVEGPDWSAPVHSTGTLEPVARIPVKSGASGLVKTLLVVEGDRVGAGQQLLELENPSLTNQLEQARSNLAAAEASLRQLLEPLADSRNQRNFLKLQAEREQATLNLEARRRELANLTVTAPQAGAVTGLPEIGTRISPGMSLFQVLDLTGMEVVFTIDELDVSRVQQGQTAVVTVDAFPDRTFRGKVVWVALQGDASDGVSSFNVKVALEEHDGLRPGMSATVEIPVAVKENVLVVPSQAVTAMGRDLGSVRVVRPDGQVENVTVETGLNTGVLVEIVSGLQDGDRVIISNSPSSAGFPADFRSRPGSGLMRPGLLPGTGQRRSGSGGGGQ